MGTKAPDTCSKDNSSLGRGVSNKMSNETPGLEFENDHIIVPYLGAQQFQQSIGCTWYSRPWQTSKHKETQGNHPDPYVSICFHTLRSNCHNHFHGLYFLRLATASRTRFSSTWAKLQLHLKQVGSGWVRPAQACCEH